MRRVVITGYGVISSSGNTVDTLWDNVVNGRSGIRKIEARQYDLFAQYAYAAAKQAVDMAQVLAIRHTLDFAISNGFGFGGHNASLLFKKWKAADK